MTGDIEVYGKRDCADTIRSRALLDRLGVEYAFHDVAADAAARDRAAALGGGPSVPVIVTASGILVEPTDDELGAALGL